MTYRELNEQVTELFKKPASILFEENVLCRYMDDGEIDGLALPSNRFLLVEDEEKADALIFIMHKVFPDRINPRIEGMYSLSKFPCPLIDMRD